MKEANSTSILKTNITSPFIQGLFFISISLVLDKTLKIQQGHNILLGNYYLIK